MVYPREVLNKLKWGGEDILFEAEIWYVHRGAPNDTRIIKGAEIEEMGRSFFRTGEAEIPYHRIKRIIP